MSFADFLEDKLLDHVFGNTAFTQPTAWHVALSTTTINDDGTGLTEPVGNGYVRKSHASWNASSGGVTSNKGAITFAAASGGAWGTITHAAVMDAASGGNMFGSAALSASKVINDTDVFEIDDTKLQVTLD